MDNLFYNIKRILSDGGRLYIRNKDGIEMDITDDMKKELGRPIEECIEDAHIMFLKKEI